MGVIVKEKIKNSGEWWLFINHKGKRKSKMIGRDRKKAIEVAKKIEAKLVLNDVGIMEQKQISTFAVYAKKWITDTVPAICKPSTASDCKRLLDKHILPALGKHKVTEINRHTVKQFLMKKANEGYSGSSITHIKNAISGVLGLAVDDEVIAYNPAQKLGKFIRTKSLQLDVDPLTRNELRLLLDTFAKHYPRHYPLALTLARTGMRIGEALALQWGDIDFNGRFIMVQRGFSRGRVETPKNGKIRRVDMSKHLTETLSELLHYRKIEKINKGWKKSPEWVFVNQSGNPVTDATHWRSDVYQKALMKAGLRKMRIHDLRHTYASIMIQAGESLAYIRDQLGHHSIKVTVDIYGHLAPEGNKEAVDRLDDNAPIRTPGAPKKERELTEAANSLIKLASPRGFEPLSPA
jgi:integrase